RAVSTARADVLHRDLAVGTRFAGIVVGRGRSVARTYGDVGCRGDGGGMECRPVLSRLARAYDRARGTGRSASSPATLAGPQPRGDDGSTAGCRHAAGF